MDTDLQMNDDFDTRSTGPRLPPAYQFYERGIVDDDPPAPLSDPVGCANSNQRGRISWIFIMLCITAIVLLVSYLSYLAYENNNPNVTDQNYDIQDYVRYASDRALYFRTGHMTEHDRFTELEEYQAPPPHLAYK
jgi:hypothetical protein